MRNKKGQFIKGQHYSFSTEFKKGNKVVLGKHWKLSEETKEKISKARMGKKLSTETRKKIALSKMGDKNPAKKLEVREKISKTLSGRPGISGEKCSLYIDGRTPDVLRIKDSYKYKEWRNKIFKRDNYTCQYCGARNRKGKIIELNAHHIKPFSEIIDNIVIFYGEKNLYKNALQYKPLWDINNGITLCSKCHLLTPSIGRESNLERAQRKHLNSIKRQFCILYEDKYSRGQKEHGGNLWKKQGIIDMAIEEALDLVGYLFTLKQQLKGKKLGEIEDKN